MIKLHMEGEAALFEKLNKMAETVGPRKTTSILKSAAAIVARAIRRFAPRGATGNLRKGAFSKGLPVKPFLPAVAIAAMNRRIAPHAHLVELGTKARYDPKHGGRFTGVMPAMPFFRPAWESVKGGIPAYIERKLQQELEKAAK